MDITGIFSEAFWYIAPILVTMTTFLAGLFNQGVVEKFVPEQHRGWLKQLVAWVFGVALSVAAWGLKVITFGNPVWLGVIALCVVVGLSSNGVYDVQFIRNWIDTWFKPKFALLDEVKEEKAASARVAVSNKPIGEKPVVKVKKIKRAENLETDDLKA